MACYEDIWTVLMPGIIIVEDNSSRGRRGIILCLPRVQTQSDAPSLLVAPLDIRVLQRVIGLVLEMQRLGWNMSRQHVI